MECRQIHTSRGLSYKSFLFPIIYLLQKKELPFEVQFQPSHAACHIQPYGKHTWSSLAWKWLLICYSLHYTVWVTGICFYSHWSLSADPSVLYAWRVAFHNFLISIYPHFTCLFLIILVDHKFLFFVWNLKAHNWICINV